MRIGQAEQVSDLPKRERSRKLSTWLSLAAAGTTVLILLFAILRNSDRTHAWLIWTMTIGLPPIVLSTLAAAQYRSGQSTGAGAAAAAVYWTLLIIYNSRSATLYFLGAPLQTAAWFLSRPRRTASRPDTRAELADHN